VTASQRYCGRCKAWHPAEGEHLCQTPEDGHTWVITGASRMSSGIMGPEDAAPHDYQDADWWGEPFSIQVRAWDLPAALRLAAEQPLAAWSHPGLEERT